MKNFYKNLSNIRAMKLGGGMSMFIVMMALIFFPQLISWQKVSAQQRSIPVNGVVVDEKGDPMGGVAVINVNNKMSGTITNERGTFSLFVGSTKDSLEFSFLG